ncbi:unnamed protein product [Orchesella dallaii]|uniref:Uncharacterized protein n=1 Tax=Orchesella dallaii TaxID=48710 RepID=A0ABP1RHM1_9HEXA
MLLVYFVYLTAVSLPFLYLYGIHWMKPCGVAIFGHWLLPECLPKLKHSQILYGKWSIISFRITLFLLNHWVWSFGCNLTAYIVSIVHIHFPLGLVGCLQVFLRNTLSNWGGIPSFRRFVLYRLIQVLALLTNETLNYSMIGQLIAGIVCQAIGLVGLVRLEWTIENAIPLGFCCFIFVNALSVLIVLLGGTACVFLEYVETFSTVK